jgi:negative regulator of replication initiation
MGLLTGCIVVSAGNCDNPKYIPWAWFWVITAVLVGGIFVIQTIREL